MIDEAVILAGGLGTRMQRIVGDNTPKQMRTYGGKPLLQWIVEELRDSGMTKQTIVVSHQKYMIMNHFGDGSKFSVQIKYAFQDNPKGGTADALVCAQSVVTSPKFLVAYADNVFHPRILKSIVALAHRYDGVVCGKTVPDPKGYGVLELDKDLVVRIYEKTEKPPSNLAIIGLFALPKQIFSVIRATPISRTGELWLTDSIQILIARGLRIGCLLVDDFWIDPNSKEELEAAKTFLESL